VKARSEKVGRNEALIRDKKVAMSLPAISRLLSLSSSPVMREQCSILEELQTLTKVYISNNIEDCFRIGRRCDVCGWK